MLRQFSDIRNLCTRRDGEIGKLEELYFDDQSRIVRYLVVDTGGWLSGREVLISPRSLDMIDDKLGNEAR
jgi:PRC-barrel domain protein